MRVDAAETVPVDHWISQSPQQTFELGKRFGEGLCGGEIVLLNGPLGAGKTLFTKGIANGLGIEADEVTSPSFTLVNKYDEGRLTLYHIDLYRLHDGAASAHAVDLDELLMDETAVFVIEWADRMGRYPLPPPVWNVAITGDGESPRDIVVSSFR